MAFIRIAWAGLLVLAMTGCAVTPQTRQSLSTYSQAMAQVTQSADVFLTDFSNGLKVQQDLKRYGETRQARVVEDYPDVLRLPDAVREPRTDAERAVQYWREALVIVQAYNDSLIALAEGRSEAEIRQDIVGLGGDIAALGNLVGLAVPAFSGFAAIGAQVIKLAQDADNRNKLEQAVQQGQAPVNTILQELEKRASGWYDLSVVGTIQAADKLREEIKATAASMRNLVAGYGPPADPAVIEAVAADGALVNGIGGRMKSRSLINLYQFTAGKPPFDATANKQVQVFIQSLSNSAEKYAELMAKQRAYHEMLVQFVVLLERARVAMDKLARNLAEPANVNTEISGALRAAFRLRESMAAYHAPAASPAP